MFKKKKKKKEIKTTKRKEKKRKFPQAEVELWTINVLHHETKC